MSDRPILFSPAMVRAILEGRKTQTRRVAVSGIWGSCKREYADHADFDRAWVDGAANDQYLHVPCHSRANGECKVCDRCGWSETVHRLWPRYRVGDALWVRETWIRHTDGSVGFLADYPKEARGDLAPAKIRWRPSILMRRADARIWLRVIAVRVQRVQDIANEDAEAEGCKASDAATMFQVEKDGVRVRRAPELEGTARGAFAVLWDSLNAGHSRGFPWRANPWVWAMTFKRELQ